MTVFKVYMKITKKNMWLIIMYLAIFMGITAIFQTTVGKENMKGYQTESVPIGVVDEDGGIVAKSLIHCLGTVNKVIELENDTEILQENLFYRNVHYIVRIPSGFMERCILEDEKLKVTTVPGSYSGYYIDQQITNFLNNAKTYAAAGFTQEEIAEAMQQRQTAKVNMVDFSGNAGEIPGYSYYYRYLPYLLLSVMCYVFGYILLGIRRGELPARMRASAVSARRQNAEGLLAAGVLSIGIWAVCTITALCLYGKKFVQSTEFIYILLNSFLLLLVSASIAYLVGMLVKDTNMLSGIVNIVSLGMCFLCGVFVSMEYLSSGVRRFAQFFPIYWYEKVNDMVTQYGTSLENVRVEIWQGMGIQIMFAAAFVCATMAAAKAKK